MKIAICLLASALVAHASIIEFDLSPPEASPAVGLHPLNEVIPGSSGGSGDELGSGIFLDTTTSRLTFDLAYGSAFGFSDLTASAFAWLLHGPSPADETAPVLFNLQSFHTFASDPAQGGRIAGSVTLNTSQQTDLLNGLGYINIYTPTHLGGEIRGQLVVVPEPTSALLLVAAAGVFWLGHSRRRKQL